MSKGKTGVEQSAEAFLAGQDWFTPRSGSTSVRGGGLYSYAALIAVHGTVDGRPVVVLDRAKYSVTTSKQQSGMWSALYRGGAEIVTVHVGGHPRTADLLAAAGAAERQ